MLGLNERATLYRRVGVRDGRPAYAAEGVAFPCRTEAETFHSAGSRGAEGGRTVRVYARGLEASPGDRVEFADGSTATLTRVETARGFSCAHHLVLTAEGNGHG